MITITCSKDLYTYNAYHLARAFFPEEAAKVFTDVSQEAAAVFDINVSPAPEGACAESRLIVTGAAKTKDETDKEIYRALSEFTGRTLPWGLLTGVRPVKPAMAKLKEGMGRDEFIKWYGKEKLVSEEKAALAWDIAKKELCILNKIAYQDKNTPRMAEVKQFPAEKDSGTKEPLRAAPCRQAQPEGGAGAELWSDTCSIYMGIPFCPGICSYCSFSLGTISRYADKTDDYVNALCREINGVSELCKGKRITCIYIGGGTPTSLSAAQLERLMLCINRNFEVDKLAEFCVEAGRPDTVTKEKLSVLKEYGADRISINPQTMQQKTLDRVGRAHSTDDVYRAFGLARRAGFDNINTDLIAGLPEEGVSDMADTLKKVLSLSPESLTVHALSIKRRAKMESQSVKEPVVQEMIRLAYNEALSAGMSPYYLYRQKSIAGNFENMGYAKPGKEGLYNILTMEEVQTIFGLGAGAETKVVLEKPAPNPSRAGKPAKILRCGNIKDIDGYINNAEEMTERKKFLIQRENF